MLPHRTRRLRIRVMFALLGIALGGNAFAAAVINLSRTSVDSGRIRTNLSAPLQPIFLTNTGDAPLTIQSLAVDGGNASDFAISGTCAEGLILGPNARCRIDIVFRPTSTDPEEREATLTIVTDAPVPAPVVQLLGAASTDARAVVPTPRYFDFASQAVGTSSPGQTVSISNTNPFSLTVTGVGLVGANAADFTFDTTCPAHSSLSGCNATVVFTPTAAGPRSAVLRYGLTAFGIQGHFEISVTGIATGSAVTANYQGLWWNPQESGWGINFAHQDAAIFATWFTFGPDNQPQWYTILAHQTTSRVYAGSVSRFSGPPFNTVPFPPNANVKTTVGTATLTFAEDGRSATFDYTVDGIAQTKQIVPQEFAQPVPTCVWGAQPDLTLATNYQDLWWVTDGQESGWGINFTHQGSTIFATWFTYDTTGKAWWLFSVTAPTDVPGVHSGLVKTATGPPFSAAPFDPNAVNRTTVGDATITIIDGNHARFDYTVNDVTQSKNLTRQVFAPPGTVCQ